MAANVKLEFCSELNKLDF